MSTILSDIVGACGDYLNNETYKHPNILIMPNTYYWRTHVEINSITGITTHERLKAMLALPDNEPMFRLFIRADIPRLIVARGNI